MITRCHFSSLLLCILLICPCNYAIANEIANVKIIQNPCLPISMPPKDVIFSSQKKVFAHYFSRFPLSIDNKVWINDYYSQGYLNENGEKNKWLANGGYLRSRPLPVPPSSKSTYIIENLKKEIKLAISRGISGFTFDILSLKDIESGSYLPNMLHAASDVDPRFKIVLMPDMSALKGDTDSIITIVKTLYDNPELYRLPDGRLVVAPFLSESVKPSEWILLKEKLNKEGFNVALVLTFLSLGDNYIRDYKDASDGLGTFGTPLPSQGDSISSASTKAHNVGKLFMAGISGQGYRPKNYSYWESEGSLAYRKSWEGAINGGADFIQLTTWNDFSESTQILPYTDLSGSSGTGFFNLTGYYASWFITGQEPHITHDVLYYFYRKQPVAAIASKAGKQVVSSPSFVPGKNLIELVGFLKESGTLVVSIGGNIYTKDVGRGVQSFNIPLASGTPQFSLTRGGKTQISFNGKTAIVDTNILSSGYADLTYWSGGASESGTCFSDVLDSIDDN